MLQGILSHTLKKSHKDAGLYLKEDEDFLYLKRGNETLASFWSYTVTIEAIWEEADRQLNLLNSGIEFVEVLR
jgi:hypothetical protein